MKQIATLLVITLALAGFDVVLGQGTTATISGNVSDGSGAVIEGAKVTATNLETNVLRTVNTQADGSYQLLFLPIGRYKVEVNATGFKKFEQTGVVLEVNRNARIDAALQLGAVTETVEVSADAAMVETTQPALGQTINNTDIENLPLVNRDLYSLLYLTAGVDSSEAATDNFGSPMQATIINGSPNSSIGSVNYTLDGGSNMNGLRNTGNVLPNPDAVQEFRVITNSYGAQYGRFAGGVVSVVTKSGTNRWNGSLFEFVRNDKLNANRWLPGQSVLQKDPLHRNQFGGTAGGPIIKNRTFIFGSYSGLRERTSVFKNDATPLTAAERLGDLSASGGTAPVDPLNNNTAFPGRQVPVSRIDPVVRKLLDVNSSMPFVPLPNLPNGKYEAQLAHPRNTDEIQIKADHNASASHRVTFGLFHNRGEDVVGLIGNIPWVSRDFNWHQYNYNASETWIVSPTKINELRVAYTRNFGGRVNLPAIALGDLGSKFQIQGTPSLPQIQVSGRFNLNSAIPGPVAGSNQYQIRNGLTITTSKHTISVGGEAVLEKMIHDTLLNNYGTFSFNTSNSRGTKNVVGDFLLGLPNTMNQDAPTTKVNNSWYFAGFAQDDFKATRRLTINMGVRWDLQTPITDTHDRLATFVPGRKSKIVASAPLGMLFPGDDGVERGIIHPDWNNFSPRLGLAWDPFGDRKTAIRGAFGLFYGSMSGNEFNGSSDNQPFAIRQQFNNVYSISDPYRLLPGGLSPYPYSYTPSNPRFFAPSAIQGISLGYKLPYSYQMNFAIQRQLTSTVNIEAAYVNNLTHRIPVAPDQNYPIYKPGASTAQNVDDRRPYEPGILGQTGLTQGILNSAYHALQVKGDKRLSHHFLVKGFYTFGKGIDVINTQNSTSQTAVDWNNIMLDRGRANNDRTHNFTTWIIWDTNYFNNSPRFLRLIANGWAVSAITSFKSGTPMTVTSGTDTNFDGNSGDRAWLIGNPYLDPNRPRNQVVEKWFNTAAFSRTTIFPGALDGNSGRNIIDGPGLKNVDMTISREFRLGERRRLQFRAEATNALNLVSLSNPGTGANSSSTFGVITTARPMRQAQLGLKLYY